jgi:hypothetical protein
VIIFPLREVFEKHKDVSVLFAKLLSALRSDEASSALEKPA